MKIDKFFQKGGYQNYRYREVRRKVNNFLYNEMEIQSKHSLNITFSADDYFLVFDKEKNQYSLNYRIDRSEKGKDDDVGMERLILEEDEAKELKKYFIYIEM